MLQVLDKVKKFSGRDLEFLLLVRGVHWNLAREATPWRRMASTPSSDQAG